MHAKPPKPPRTPGDQGKNFCARELVPTPRALCPAPAATLVTGEPRRFGGSGPGEGLAAAGQSHVREEELVPLGWERNTHTSSRRALSLSPPPASTSSTTTTSSSPPTPAGLRKRFSRTSTWLLHFEAAPGRLYRPGSSLGNVVRVPGRAGAWGCAKGLQVPECPGLRGWVLNRLPRADQGWVGGGAPRVKAWAANL